MQVHYPESQYAAFLKQGRFMLQRSPTSGRYVFPPRAAACAAGEFDLEWVEAKGTGTVCAITEIAQRRSAGESKLVLVDLDEGPRVPVCVEGAGEPTLLAVGTRVKARVLSTDKGPVLVFEPLLARTLQ